MPVTLRVKSEEPTVRAQREAAAQRVLDYFDGCLPSSRLLCFLDDDDPPILKQVFGVANRGVYGPINDSTPLADWPEYVSGYILVDDGVSLFYPRVIDDLVYLYGSTCANEVGLTMTLAHELQHAIQHANARKVWAVNGLVPQLPKTVIAALNLQWADIPIERETRVVSKRVAVHFFGKERVRQYIDEKIAEANTRSDVADVSDWQFVRALTPSSSVEIVGDTQRLFQRLKGYRSELEMVLQEKKHNPDFGDINLDAYFGGA
jgi:hypothetical protein